MKFTESIPLETFRKECGETCKNSVGPKAFEPKLHKFKAEVTSAMGMLER